MTHRAVETLLSAVLGERSMGFPLWQSARIRESSCCRRQRPRKSALPHPRRRWRAGFYGPFNISAALSNAATPAFTSESSTAAMRYSPASFHFA